MKTIEKLTNYYKILEGYRKIYLPVPFDIEDAKDIPNTDESPAVYNLRDEYGENFIKFMERYVKKKDGKEQ